MPGLALRLDAGGGAPAFEQELSSALAPLTYLDDYESEVLLERPGLSIGCTSYPGYPVETIEDGETWLYLEGVLYDRDGRAEGLRSFGRRLLSGELDEDDLSEWLRQTDGDFVLLAVDTATGEAVLVNDPFRRLPLYYYRDEDHLVLSRDVQFVLSHLPEVTFDELSLAQILLFGYPLGDRTLWSEVVKVAPGSRLTIGAEGSVQADTVHRFDFDGFAHADRSVEENASNLASLFVEACRGRDLHDRENVLSLSGGLDSRAIGAASRATDLHLVGATFERAEDGTTADAEIAGEIASALDLEWELYRLSGNGPDRMDRLLELKNGLNSLGMGFILEFFDRLRSDFGSRMTYFTGDGGDKTIPSLAPVKPLHSLDDLVSYIVANNSVFPIERVEALTGVTEDEIVESVRTVVSRYPERNFERRYVHFLVYERAFNRLFEGEDRNRCFFWSVSPFYSMPFFRYAMEVPDDQKARDRLYREFLAALWPRSLQFDNANWGTPPTSLRYQLTMYGLDVLERYPTLWNVARTVYRGEVNYEYPEEVRSIMQRQFDECDAISQYLSPTALSSILEDRRSCDSSQVYRLLTLTSVIDKHRCGNVGLDGREALAAK